MLELGWRVKRAGYRGLDIRKIKLILISPVIYSHKVQGWNCHITHDPYGARGEIPYTTYYKIDFLRHCENQSNLKIISEAQIKNEK